MSAGAQKARWSRLEWCPKLMNEVREVWMGCERIVLRLGQQVETGGVGISDLCLGYRAAAHGIRSATNIKRHRK